MHFTITQRVLIFQIILLFKKVEAIVNFYSCDVSSTNAINQYGTYSFNLVRTGDSTNQPENLYTTYYVQIVFPWTLNDNYTCHNDIQTTVSCEKYSSTTINIKSYFSQNYTSTQYANFTGYQFSISLVSILNPSYGGQYDSSIQIYFMDASNSILEQCPNSGINPTTNPGSATCSGNGLSSKVNTINASIQLNFTVANVLATGSYLSIIITQYWQNDSIQRQIINSTVTCQLYANSYLVTATCTQNSNLNITQLLTNVYFNSQFSIILTGINAPSYVGSVGNFIISSYNSNNKIIDQCTLSSISGWSANTITLSSLTWTNIVNKVGQLVFSFYLSSPLIINDIITITIPSEITINTTLLTVVFEQKSLFQSSTNQVFTISGQNIIIVTTKSFSATSTSIQFTFSNVLSPPSIKPTSTISIFTMRGSYLIDQSTASLTISASTGSFNSISIVAINTVINELSNYNVNITISNPLTVDGYLTITFPSQFDLTQLTTISDFVIGGTSYANAAITISSQKVTISQLYSQSILGNTYFSFTLSKIKNQFSANVSNPFTISTYYSLSSNNYLVDISSTYQMSKFTIGTIDQSSILIQTITYKTGQNDNYTIIFENTNSITANGYILITIPTDITITSGSQICTINSVSSTCTQVGSTNVIKIILTTAISAQTTISIVINNLFTNPYTLKQYTNCLTIVTYDNENLQIDSGTGGTIQMLYLSSFSLSLYSRGSTINGVTTQYTFLVNFEVKQINNIYLIITLPQELIPTSTYSCSSISPLATSLDCLYTDTDYTLRLKLVCDSCTELSKSTNFYFTISSITNYISFMPLTINSGYTIQILTDSLSKSCQFTSSVSIQNQISNTLSSFSQTYQYGYLDQLDNYTFNITVTNNLIGQFNITLIVPSDIIVQQTTSTNPTTVSNTIDLPNDFSYSLDSQTIRISGTTSTSISNFQFQINNILNPNTTQSQNKFQLQTYQISGTSSYLMDSQYLNYFIHKCTLPCKDCDSTSLTKCLSCYDLNRSSLVSQQIYFLEPQNSCITACTNVQGYFVISGEYTCSKCDDQCETCQNQSDYCLTCSQNFVYLDYECLDQCPDHYYNNSNTCSLCSDNCITCTNNAICTKCESNYYLYQSKCTITCPTQITIPDDDNFTCNSCTNNCATCQTTTSYCLTCNTNYYFYNNSCMQNCQDGTYISDGYCKDCLDQCKTCINNTSCKTCDSSLLLYNNDCVDQCPDQYYASSGSCQQCNQLCYTCETNSTTCTGCYTSTYLYNSKCYSSCNDGYYADNESNQCVLCKSPCKTCQNTESTCLSCVVQTPTLYYYNNSCNTSCLIYYAPENGSCVQCRIPCKQCTTTPDTCSYCYSGFYLLNDQCLGDCGDGYFKDTTNLTCNICDSSCETCSGSKTYCTSCNEQQILFNHTCIDQCQDGYYEFNQTCQKCLTSCATCSDGTTCNSCNNSLIFYNNQCLSECPSNLFYQNDTCVGCTSPCLTCYDTPTTCLTCVSSTYLNLSQQCVKTCDDGYYADQASNKCISCISPCKNCLSLTSCLSCVEQTPILYYYNNSCNTSCLSDYIVVDNLCVQCESPCLTCINTINTCLTCQNSYYLKSNECLTNCGDGYYQSTTENICQICVSPCLTCTSQTQCLSCDQTTEYKIYYQFQCLSSCSTGYYVSNGTCIQCTIDSTDSSCQSTVDVLKSMQSEKYIPIPFTILTFIFIISVIIAKIQKPETFIPSAITAVGGLLEWLSYSLLLFLSYLNNGIFNTQNYIILGALGINLLLNIIHLILAKVIYHKDLLFQQWFSSKRVNRVTYIILTFLGFLFTFKLNKLIVSRYFGFYFFKAKIQNVSELLPFNVISLISILLSSIPMIVASTYILYLHDNQDQLYISSIDTIIVTMTLMISQIWDAQKQDNFFQDSVFSPLNQSVGQQYQYDQEENQQINNEIQINHDNEAFNNNLNQQNNDSNSLISNFNFKNKNFYKNKSAIDTKIRNSQVVSDENPYFLTQNNNNSSFEQQNQFEEYLNQQKGKHTKMQSLNISSIVPGNQSYHETDQDQETNQEQYQLQHFQNPVLLSEHTHNCLNFTSDADYEQQISNRFSTPNNFNSQGDVSIFQKKRIKTIQILPVDQQEIDEIAKQKEVELKQQQIQFLKEQEENQRLLEELKKFQEEQFLLKKYQEEEREKALQERQKNEEELQKQENLRLSQIEQMKKEIEYKEQQLLQEKEEQEKIFQQQLLEEEQKRKEQEIKEQELQKELEKEREERLKFQQQLQEKLQKEQEEYQRQQLIELEKVRIKKEQDEREEQKRIKIENERIRKEQEEQIIQEQKRKQKEQELLEQQKIVEEQIRLKKEEELKEQERIKIELEQAEIQRLEKERLEMEAFLKEQLLKEQIEKEKEILQILEKENGENNQNELEQQIKFHQQQLNNGNLFLTSDIERQDFSDDEVQPIQNKKTLPKTSIQSVDEEIINFDKLDSPNNIENDYVELNNPNNLFQIRHSAVSVKHNSQPHQTSRIAKTIQDAPRINQQKGQYQFKPANSISQNTQSKIVRSSLKYPNNQNPYQNKLVIGTPTAQYQNQSRAQTTINREVDERYLRQKQEIYLQHLPNYYEKQIQQNLKRKQSKKTHKQNYNRSNQIDDDAQLDF